MCLESVSSLQSIMKIYFVNNAIMDRCNKEQLMLHSYGQTCSNFLKRRLIQLAAAESLGVFSPQSSPPLRCSCVTASRKNQFQIPLGNEYVLIFEAKDGDRLLGCKGLNWNTIKSIVILTVDKNQL